MVNHEPELAMKYFLVDKVDSLESGKRIKTSKCVTLAEEYLSDHFPTFPVLPGVLQLQGLIESAAWLVREAENFAHSMILLKQTRNVKFKRFLAPGERITYTITVKALEEELSSFEGHGESAGRRVVEARFALRHFNLVDRGDSFAAADAEVIESLKSRWKRLCS